MFDEATSARSGARRVDRGVLGKRAARASHLHAREVPFDFAAEVVEVADFIAAATIIATRIFVHRVAGDVLAKHRSCVATAATRDVAHGGIVGAASAVVIPTRCAAEGVDRAHGFATCEIVAVGAFV